MFRICLFFALVGVLTQPLEAGKYNRDLEIGNQAPAWSKLPGVDDKEHSLTDLKNKEVVVVAFTCNSCPYSVDYEDRICAFVKEYCGTDSKVALVAINVNKVEEDALPAMKERATSKKFLFPYLFDETQKIAFEYGAARTPEFFVLNRDRKVVYMGAFDDNSVARKVEKNYLEEAVKSTLSGKAIEIAETNPIGCNIRFERRRRARASTSTK